MTAVVGVVERQGKIEAGVVPDNKTKTFFPIIENKVVKDSKPFTSEYRSYKN